MAPRGLSAEEKRVKLVEIFHETKDFFQLKELEKLGPKMKGIVSQSVKEVLQSLVDDGLVQTDKVGSSNFFWSFPSQRGAIMQNRVDAARETQKLNQQQLAELRASIEAERASRPESEERTASLAKLVQYKKEVQTLETELQAYGACDPAKVEEKKRAVILAKEAAVRWTDNYLILLSHFTRQNGVEADDVRKYLGVGEDYEDIC
ncbi:meiotic nuclear division protein 1 [Dentipellis sp. KUC8613]|nr:meiotic nuclear division protein 1 [Dentipellis sp. KUC8613]